MGKVRLFPYAQRTDADLGTAIVHGEAAALGPIWDRYVRAVRGLVYVMLGPDSAIDDVVHEVFLELYKSAARFRDPRAVRPCLLGIAARRASMELRGRSRRHRWFSSTKIEVRPERAPEESPIEARDALRALSTILGQIKDREAMAFVLHHVHSLSPAEVSAALGVSERTAKRAIAKGRTRVATLAAQDEALRAYLHPGDAAADERGRHG